jgi:hypothetical protein
MRPRIAGFIALLNFAFICSGCVDTTTMAVTASATPPTTARTQPKAVPCALRIGQILDERMDPTVLGRVNGRTVRSPADAQAWLRTVIAGLAGQGIMVDFSADGAAPAGAIDADARLKTAWVDSAATAKLASVVLNMQYSYRGTSIKTADYRGSVSTVNWNNTTNEVQSMVDDALAQVLTQLATDFRGICSRTNGSHA